MHLPSNLHSSSNICSAVFLSVLYRDMQQLDKQMHKMMLEKHKRSEEIKADQAALEKIDATISTHIQPCLVRASQTQLAQQLAAELPHKPLAEDNSQSSATPNAAVTRAHATHPAGNCSLAALQQQLADPNHVRCECLLQHHCLSGSS
jgi:hypothetical protein